MFRFDDDSEATQCNYCQRTDADIHHVLDCGRRPLFACPCGWVECKTTVYHEDVETEKEAGLVPTVATLAKLVLLYHPLLPGFTCMVCQWEVKKALLVNHMELHDDMDQFLRRAISKLDEICENYKPDRVKTGEKMVEKAANVLEQLNEMSEIVNGE